MFFDESYQEEYYRGESIVPKIEDMDCLIVIGTELETNLASKIVSKAIGEKILIVEMNPKPCIQYGNVRHLIGGSEKFVPEIFKTIQQKLTEKKSPAPKVTQRKL